MNTTLYWPNGWTELTQVGMRQQFELGQYLRDRYDGFLPQKYSHSDILATSSDVDRAIQSAEANLAALYKSALHNDNDEIQMVPIHTLPKDMDIWIQGKVNCPRYHELLETEYANNPDILQFKKDNQEFVKFIAEKAGLSEISVDFNDVLRVEDALRCENFHNLTTSWATDEVRQRLDHFQALDFVWITQTEEMKRLRAGPMIGKLLNNFKMDSQPMQEQIPIFDDEHPTKKKFYFYSGHDFTIAGVLGAWNILDPHIPPYATALMLKLHKGPEDKESHLKIFYRNETNREPYKLAIPECGSPCYLSKLIEISDPIVPKDWKHECQAQPKLLKSNGPYQALDFAPSIPVEVVPLKLNEGLIRFGSGVLVVGLFIGIVAYCTNFILKNLKTKVIINAGGTTRYQTFV